VLSCEVGAEAEETVEIQAHKRQCVLCHIGAEGEATVQQRAYVHPHDSISIE
jgi:hypothetical protein